MQLHEIRRVTLQQFAKFSCVTLDFNLDWFVGFDVFEIDGEFHVCTCLKS